MNQDDREIIATWHSFKRAIEAMESDQRALEISIPLLRKKLEEHEMRYINLLPPRSGDEGPRPAET